MDSIKFNKRTTRMVAHRGFSGVETENSCAAFVAAGNRSYFGIETDVHVTADGGLVVIHDDSTARVSRQDLPIEGSTYEDLRAVALLDHEGKTRTDLRIPSLEEYLHIVSRYDKTCVLELKNAFTREQLEKVLATIRACGTEERMIYISFQYDTLCLLRELLPEAPIQFLCDCPVDAELIAKLKAHRFDLDIGWDKLTREAIEQLHAEGIVVNCWTVDDPKDAEKLAEWGIDFITTDILE